MPDYTPRLNLPKPLGSENVTRKTHNDLIDAIEANAAKKTDVNIIVDSTTNTKYQWKIANGQMYLEEVV